MDEIYVRHDAIEPVDDEWESQLGDLIDLHLFPNRFGPRTRCSEQSPLAFKRMGARSCLSL